MDDNRRAHLAQELDRAQARVRDIEQELGYPNSPINPQNLLKVTIEQMHEGIQIIDRGFRYIYINDAAAQHGQMTKEALLGRTMTERYPAIETTEVYKAIAAVMNDRTPRRMENLFDFPNGTRCWFDIHIEPHTLGALIRSIDITARKRIEEHYQHAQKMESIGLLAGGMAHDFNNKLGIMVIYCELLEPLLAAGDAAANRYLQSVLRAITDASALTRQLLAFSRKQVLDFKIVSLNDVILGASDGLRKLVGERIELNTFIDPELVNVRVDASQIDQVLLNLCVNAKDAMPNGGVLTLETSNVELDAEYCASHVGVSPGRHALLTVTDTGTGMSSETKSRMFEPFYTTKGTGKGTGLGLASVHGIVTQSHGHINVISETGKGTSFKIYFPQVREKKQLIEGRLGIAGRTDGSESVLLVEDDSLLRNAIADALVGAGYKVLAAADADEAKELFMHQKGEIDLLLTDLVLPESSGNELAEEICALKANLRVVYISGYSETANEFQALTDSKFILIQKPISMKTLLRTMRQVLDGELVEGVV